MELSWLAEFVDRWRSAVTHGRQPHAVLLAGPRGTGKRAAAAWMVSGKLGRHDFSALPAWPFGAPQFADLRWLSVPESRKAILIEQVRDLVDDLSLTSYEGRGKAAVIEPADAMTRNAANSLLKTLEEPPGDALLILVVDRPGRLPATILSRCQRLEFRAPPEAQALAWLEQARPGIAWAEALRAAGGAPLTALNGMEQLEAAAQLRRELAAVGAGDVSPVTVAAAWTKLDPPFVLEWLAREVQSVLRARAAGRAGHVGMAETVLPRMDSPKLFCYLDAINRLRGQAEGSYNVQLALEGLLIDWATGLSGQGSEFDLRGTNSRRAGA